MFLYFYFTKEQKIGSFFCLSPLCFIIPAQIIEEDQLVGFVPQKVY